MLSIITPVLNGEKYIELNIEAISKLSIPYEHIIVDGGSIDSTIKIIEKYTGITLINQKEKNGMYGAINQGILASKGNYLAYVNCDDIIYPENYAKLYRRIENSEYEMIYSDGVFKYSNNTKKEYFKSPKFMFKYFMINGIMPFIQPSSIFTREVYDKLNGFDDLNFKWNGDYDFFRRLLQQNNAICYLNIPTVEFLKHENSLTSMYYTKLDEEKIANEIPVSTLFTRIIYFIVRKLKL